MIREAFLAATMNLVPAAPVDIFRFLRVPAIVFMYGLRRQSRRFGWAQQNRFRRLRRRC